MIGGASLPRAIFFDVDFTLIHPGPVLQGEGYARACAAHGVEVDAVRFDAAVAAASFILDEVEEPVYDEAVFIHYTARIIEEMGGRGAGVVPAARALYAEWASNHHFDLYDDALPVLEALAGRGHVIGVISNSHRSLDLFRSHFALDRLITVAVSSQVHGYLKPHRSIFDVALQQAGAAPDEALMVGDSLRADVGGALAAGWQAVLIRRSGDHPPALPAGVRVITSLRDLL